MSVFRICLACLAAWACAWPTLRAADDAKDKPKVEEQTNVNAEPKPGASLPVYRLHELMKIEVRDTTGRAIGKIEDLVVELHSGDVRYAALSVGGLAGIGNKLFAIPLSEMAFEHTSIGSRFVVDMSPDKFKAAPGFAKDNWPDFANPNWSAEVDKFYFDKNAKHPKPTEKGQGDVDKSSVYRASKIDGMHVKNTEDQSMGKVADIVVDMRHSKVRYAALEFGGFLGLGDKLFAIPWKAFDVRVDSKGAVHLVLHISKDRLKNAPGFDKKHWPDTGDPMWSREVDRHYQNDVPVSSREKQVK